MATLVFLAGYLVYVVCMISLWFLVLAAVFPSSGKLSSIMIPIAFIFPLALNNFPWVVLISESSIVSQVLAMLLCLACYLTCTLIGLVVLNVGLFRPAPRGSQKQTAEESPGYRHVIVGSVAFVVMDVFMSYSSMVVNDMQGAAVLVEKPSFTSQFLSIFGIESTVLGYLVGVLATLVALWALSFLVALALSGLSKILLPLDAYPKSRSLTILVLTFMVMKYMVEKSSLISGMNATLLGLADWIGEYQYHVLYLVVRYVTFVALASLPQVTTVRGEYHKAAAIISVALVLTMRPSTPVEKPSMICASPSSTAAASAGGLDDFIRFSEEMMVEHKLAMEKIVLQFNLLIQESKGEIKSFIVHTILILMTLMGGTVFYVRDRYSSWMSTLEQKVPAWMKRLLLNRVK